MAVAAGHRPTRPVGVSGAPDQPSVWNIKVKSWVSQPIMDVESGQVQIYGVAFGSTNPVY